MTIDQYRIATAAERAVADALDRAAAEHRALCRRVRARYRRHVAARRYELRRTIREAQPQ